MHGLPGYLRMSYLIRSKHVTLASLHADPEAPSSPIAMLLRTPVTGYPGLSGAQEGMTTGILTGVTPWLRLERNGPGSSPSRSTT